MRLGVELIQHTIPTSSRVLALAAVPLQAVVWSDRRCRGWGRYATRVSLLLLLSTQEASASCSARPQPPSAPPPPAAAQWSGLEEMDMEEVDVMSVAEVAPLQVCLDG